MANAVYFLCHKSMSKYRGSTFWNETCTTSVNICSANLNVYKRSLQNTGVQKESHNILQLNLKMQNQINLIYFNDDFVEFCTLNTLQRSALELHLYYDKKDALWTL